MAVDIISYMRLFFKGKLLIIKGIECYHIGYFSVEVPCISVQGDVQKQESSEVKLMVKESY